jgi:major type 1 subunit fimbrin (pilin)
MQKIFAIGAISAAALCALFGASNASAQTATLNFNGNLTSGTCTLSVDGGTGTTVTLPTISVTSFTTSNNPEQGRTRFILHLSACTGKNIAGNDISVAVPYFDYTSANVNPTTNNLKNTSPSPAATGVELRLIDAPSNDPILLAAAPTTTPNGAGSQTAQMVTVASITGLTATTTGTATIPLYVEYYATSTNQPGAGGVTSSVPITMQYN